jgi:hypothetical protein
MSFWTRSPNASDSTRRFAIFPASNVVLEMKPVTAEQMDGLYKSDEWYKTTEKKDILLAVPVYYDLAGRVWPRPLVGWVVADEIVPDTKADDAKK